MINDNDSFVHTGMPVSYTHLPCDNIITYPRGIVCCRENNYKKKFAAGDEKKKREQHHEQKHTYPETVSYTHLDVYKRQARMALSIRF